jgi:plastocyanin
LKAAMNLVPAMIRNAPAVFVSTLLLCAIVLSAGSARAADELVTLSIAIKDHQFEPAEVHAPAGRPIAFAVKNLGTIAAEFESGVLHVEKVIPPGGEAVVHVRPLAPGRYNFFDDFHRQTQGFLVVP